VKNRFHTRPVFSEDPPWSLPDKPPPAAHHGFIHDPDADTKTASAKPGPTRY